MTQERNSIVRELDGHAARETAVPLLGRGRGTSYRARRIPLSVLARDARIFGNLGCEGRLAVL
eukprot:918906-Amorphochlora_amoeboformis.AAC.1